MTVQKKSLLLLTATGCISDMGTASGSRIGKAQVTVLHFQNARTQTKSTPELHTFGVLIIIGTNRLPCHISCHIGLKNSVFSCLFV